MSRPHDEIAEVQVLDEDLISCTRLPNSGDGGLEGNVAAMCGPPAEQVFRRVCIPIDLLHEDVAVEDLDRSVAHGEPLAEMRRALVNEQAELLRAGGALPEIVVVIDDGEVAVLDGRHRVAAARLAGRRTLPAFECVGALRGFAHEP